MTTRAAAAAKTREKIVRAACVVYAREGFRNASMQAIAQEADVSPTTVLNQFETSDKLLAEVLAHLTAQLGLPDPEELKAHARVEDRVAALAVAFAICYERGQKLYAVYSRDQDMPVVQAADAAFFRRVEELVRAALGPGLRDKRTVTVVLTLTGWQNYQALRTAGMSAEAAGEVIAEVVVGWLRSQNRLK